MASTITAAGRNGNASGPTGAPVNRTNIKPRRTWRPGLLILSLLLIVGSMLAGIWLYQSSTTRVGVLVAASDLSVGQTLTVADTRVQYISAEPEFLNTVFSEEQARDYGFYSGAEELLVTRPVPAGSPLVPAYLMPRSGLVPDDKSIVGIKMDSGTYPSGMTGGDTVALTVSSSDNEATEATEIGRATLWSVSIDANSGTLLADLVVDRNLQNAVVQAQRKGNLRIALVGTGS